MSTSKKQKNVPRILSPTVVIAGLWTNFALAISSKPFNVFHYKTARTLKEVLSTLGYFEEAAECLIRKLDRIEVIANADGIAEFATLAVRSVTTKGEGKGVKVSKLEQASEFPARAARSKKADKLRAAVAAEFARLEEERKSKPQAPARKTFAHIRDYREAGR